MNRHEALEYLKSKSTNWNLDDTVYKAEEEGRRSGRKWNDFSGVLAGSLILGMILLALTWMVYRTTVASKYTAHVDRKVEAALQVQMTPQESHKLLGEAIDFIKAQGPTEGYTSVLWDSEDDNMGRYFSLLVAADGKMLLATTVDTRAEQDRLVSEAHSIMAYGNSWDKTGTRYDVLDVPEGASVFPHNVAVAWWILSAFIMLGLLIALVWDCDHDFIENIVRRRTEAAYIIQKAQNLKAMLDSAAQQQVKVKPVDDPPAKG